MHGKGEAVGRQAMPPVSWIRPHVPNLKVRASHEGKSEIRRKYPKAVNESALAPRQDDSVSVVTEYMGTVKDPP
jgi:hypothetical protein